MKPFLFFLLGALMSSTSFSSLIEQSAKIEMRDLDSNKNRDKRGNLPAEEHQVTVKEYCDFLNAVATTSDPHNLYDKRMGSNFITTCITRSVTPYHYVYSVVEGKEELPIIHVSWFDQARYCNWMENGQQTGCQGPETTENGVYTLNGDKVVAVNSDTTYLLKDDEEGNVSPQFMMEPAAIEETVKTLKRELGVLGKKESTAQAALVFLNSGAATISQFTENAKDSATSSVFTIEQNHTIASNAFSSTQQPIDPVFKKQIERAIEKVITYSSAQLQDHYKKADEAWSEYDRGWKEYSRLGHELQESCKQLTLSEQKCEQASNATTSEELEKTRLGKIAKYAGIAGDALGHVPEPHAQLASVGVSKLAGFANTINTTCAKVNLALAKIEHQQVSKQHEQAQERKNQAYQKLLPLEQRAEEIETLALAQAEQTIKKLAEQLHPQRDWRESQWHAWVSLVDLGWSDKEKLYLIEQARLNTSWIEEVTKKSWEQKIEIGKEGPIALQKKANLAPLKNLYENDCKQYECAKTQEEQQRRYLDQSQNSIENLKDEIEKRVDELEKLERRDKIQFERKKKEFIEKLKALEKTQQQNQGLQKKWEEAVQRTSTQEEQRWTASETYQNAKKAAERTLVRVKKAYQTDRELLQRIWLKSAFSNYKDWSLPEIRTSQITENILEALEETRRSEECEPPLQRFEELEAQGRNLRLREAMMITLTTTERNSELGAIKNPFSRQPSSLYSSQSNLDQVKEWAQKRQEQPSFQDQKRWEIREKLDRLQTEVSSIRKELKKEVPFIEGERRNDSNEPDDDDDDMSSKFSAATKRTAATTSLSVSQSSILSFGGKTLFNSANKKQPLSSLPSINEETQDFQEKLTQLEQETRKLKKEYFDLLDHAEDERLNSCGQEATIPFSEEEDRNYAWEKADRKSVVLIQEKSREKKLEKLAQEQQESWQMNTERWRARVQADEAYKISNQANKQASILVSKEAKARTREQQIKAERNSEEALAEAKRLKEVYFTFEEEWEKMDQEYRGERPEQTERVNEEAKEKANEPFKERDRAVNQRWEKLPKNYQNSELEKSAVEQEEISEFIMSLQDQLELSYKESLIKYNNQEALAHYKEVTFQRALENARKHPEEMAEAWERIGEKTENIDEAQLEINKQAAVVFKKEAKRLERIERIWKGILEREQQEAKQIREQAAQEYYRGNISNWNALSFQEKMNYNNEVKKANEAYDKKREEVQELIAEAETEKLRIEAEIKREEDKKSMRNFFFPKSKKEKLKQSQQQLVEVENTIRKTSEQLKKQEVALNLGIQQAQQQKIYCQSLNQSLNSEKRASKGETVYWQQAIEFYQKASIYWKKAINDEAVDIKFESSQNKKIASLYGKTAEFYEKAAQKKDSFLAIDNKVKETWILLYNEAAEQYKSSAECYYQATITSKEGKEKESRYWYQAFNCFNKAAGKLQEAIKFGDTSNAMQIEQYSEVSKQYKLSAECYTKIIKAPDTTFDIHKCKMSWENAACVFRKAAENLEKVISKSNDNLKSDLQLVKKYSEVADAYKCSGGYYIQEAEAYKAGKLQEITDSRQAANTYQFVAGKLEKAIDVESNNNSKRSLKRHLEEAEKYREEAKKHKLSHMPYIKAARAHAANSIEANSEEGKADTSKGFEENGNCYSNEAIELVTSIKDHTEEVKKNKEKEKEGILEESSFIKDIERKDLTNSDINSWDPLYYYPAL